MSDLSFQNVLDQLPAGSIAEDAGTVTVNINALTGEAALALTDTKVTEFISKLLKGCEAAQSAYNTANVGSELNTYPASNLGIPTDDGSGNLIATRSHTVTAAVPLNEDEITANPL
jgi:hypothetical protein